MPSVINEDVLNQLKGEQSELLDKIDDLRTIGVGGLVELPQIVVCGNQSSGKSSVLEAISRVRFPAKSNICTRFATEIVLRRHPSNKITVSIEPGNSREDIEEREKLRAFTSESFSSGEDLPALIDSAKKCMGLSSTDSLVPNSGFSDDVLRIEISGPDRPELTLVDLPGLYYSTSSEQGEPGMKIVKSLTENYMKNSRTIILAVISARNDYHIQKVLNMAQEFDPKYERVLGIVTQPDIPEAGSEDEEYYLQLIRNEKVKLQLGWHVLRNRSYETMNVSDDARDVQEKAFFDAGRWASLPRERVGIESLRHRLSTILLAHIRRSLPSLIVDIQKKILHNEQALAQLGTSRSTLQEQRRFLVDISSKFARITNQALNGSYVDQFFGGYKHHTANTTEFALRRLRAIVRELNECFADAMRVRGSRRIITSSLLPDFDTQEGASKPYMNVWSPEYITLKLLEEEIKEKARESRGIELPGSANQLLFGSLFRDQCKPWKKIAKAHLLNVWSSVEYFVQLVLKYLVDDHARASLMRHLISPELEKMKEKLMEKLEELVSYYNRGHPLPLGNSFLSKMRDIKSSRQLRIDLDRTAGVERPCPSSDEFGAEQIIDQMKAYYDTTIVTFVENVAILGIENCLLSPLEDVFSSQTVVDMDDNQVQKVAAEPSETQRERTRLNEELEKLRRGRQTLDAYKPDETSLPKLPILGLSTLQASAPRSAVKLPQSNVPPALTLAPAPAQNTVPNPPLAPAQKANVAQGSWSFPSTSVMAEAATATPTPAVPKPSSNSSKVQSFASLATPNGQAGAPVGGYVPSIFGSHTSSSKFGHNSSSAPRSEAASPFASSSTGFGSSSLFGPVPSTAFRTSSGSATGSTFGGQSSPSATNADPKLDPARRPKTKEFTQLTLG